MTVSGQLCRSLRFDPGTGQWYRNGLSFPGKSTQIKPFFRLRKYMAGGEEIRYAIRRPRLCVRFWKRRLFSANYTNFSPTAVSQLLAQRVERAAV